MNRNLRTGLLTGVLAVSMVGVSYAAVPLYEMFCQVTGFAGTPVRAAVAPGATAGEVGVRFDSNISSALPWKFEPVEQTVRIPLGARTQIAYRAKNLTARSSTGTATFNVSPAIAGQYFSKIECFCFTEQTLRPGQSVDMPVTFFVDPEIRTNPDTSHIDEITLSYTFYPVETPRSGG